jgi:hypothetical protein
MNTYMSVRFWTIETNGVKHQTPTVGPLTAVQQKGPLLLGKAEKQDEIVLAELNLGWWVPRAPHFPIGRSYENFEVVAVPMEPDKLVFADLKQGDKFIAFPLPGDNHGHGGYLGANYLFVVTQEARPQRDPTRDDRMGLAIHIGRGVESTCPGTMPVLKIE